jgi:hypothetical protein
MVVEYSPMGRVFPESIKDSFLEFFLAIAHCVEPTVYQPNVRHQQCVFRPMIPKKWWHPLRLGFL